MTKKHLKVLLLSIATLLCVVALVVAFTFALYSKSVEVGSNHLNAGKLDITLLREGYDWTHVNEEGFIDEVHNADPVDFSDSENNDKNIFGFEGNTWVAPGCTYAAHMALVNNGNVAFTYWIEIVLDDENETDNYEELAKQLRITVTLDDGSEYSNAVYEGLTVGNGEDDKIPAVKLNQTSRFTVAVEFLNDIDEGNDFNNDEAQWQQVSFDLVVHATQAAAE